MTDTPEIDALNAALAGRYVVERELGRGGMGVVLLARDLSLDRLVAIKLLPPNLASQSDLRERFLREVRTAASLSHPNIVPIFSIEDAQGLVFYVMGFIEGETLTQRVRRAGPLAPGDAARILQECAWGLGYAHGRGIVHRDVKADNILIERGTGRAYVTDFGIARVANNATMTAIGETLGTPHYMSPEQAAGEPLDGRSDLYSLGIVGYFALTGTLPFDASSVQAILAMHLTKAPPGVGTVRAGIPAKLSEAIDKCLAKEPGDRFATCEAFVTAIQSAQTTRAEIAPPVRMFQRMAEISVAQMFTVTVLFVFLYFNAGKSPLMIPMMWIAIFVVLLAQLRARAIGLVAQGFGHDDVVAAFADEARERKEAAVANAQLKAPKIGIVTIGGALLGIALTATGLAIGIPSKHGTWQNTAGKMLISIGPMFFVLSFMLRLFRNRSGARTMSLSTTVWSGAFGRAFFRSAATGARVEGITAPSAASSTQSVSGLIAALASKERKELGDTQRVIVQLEQQVRASDQRIEQIEAAIAEATRAVTSQGGEAHRASRDSLMADLTGAREAADRRKAELLTMLEEFRAGLVRIRAGIATGGDLKPAIERARALLARAG
jgi:eukaryotic-like serine/threonine-protein kinase